MDSRARRGRQPLVVGLVQIGNVFRANDPLTATAVQPDGAMRRAMIREGRSWTVTNTFEF